MSQEPHRYRVLGKFRALRWGLIAIATLMAGYSLAAIVFDGPSSSRILNVVWWPIFAMCYALLLRRETVITPTSLILWAGTLRPRVIDIGQVTSVYLRTSYSPVRADLDTGETIELPGIKPDQLIEVKELLDHPR